MSHNMSHGVLVINAGSSSIKFSVFTTAGKDLTLNSRGQVEGIGVVPNFVAKNPDGQVLEKVQWENSKDVNHTTLMKFLLDWISKRLNGAKLLAAGHRVVHGGKDYRSPIKINSEIMQRLETLIPLAPLHQPHNIAAIKALAQAYPDLPQVACFDTSFHRTNPMESQMFFLPKELYSEGVMRYGFHGLSYEYISEAMIKIDPSLAMKKVIVLHLGSGASMCALNQGRSHTTSMGLTALDGIPMGTRPGTIDSGSVLYLMREKNMGAKEIEDLLYKKSGLLGWSKISNDMRVLEESQDPAARETLDFYSYKINLMIGQLTASLGGLDALIFTAGIGENSPKMRDLICKRTAWMGVELDGSANKANSPVISSSSSKVKVLVIPTNEELMIARHTLNLT